MGASGNSIALKSFQSFAVNEGLLAKVVEAVKSGEKEARTSGDVKSFEVFYKGFRQNIAIGRIYIVPAKVCNDRSNFPVALLYGTVVRELNLGEETADLITNKIGDTEFDEYSQADFTTIKEKFFTGADGKETSLIVYAPHWANIRDYICFKYTSEDGELTNLLRHLVFAAYFNPAVSSAFDALMTNVDTYKFDVTDITPKLTYPALSQNPLKAYPDLVKTGSVKGKIFLTAKTADAITKEVLDPEEMDVFEALDTALTDATFPETKPMEEVADFKGPDGVNEGNIEIPEVDAPATLTTASVDDGTGLRRRPDYGEKGSYTQVTNEENAKAAALKMGARFNYNATNCPDCGMEVDAFKMCPQVSGDDARQGQQFCGKGKVGPNASVFPARGDAPRAALPHVAPFRASVKKADTADNPANEKGGEGAIEVKTDKEISVTAAASAPFEAPFTNVGPGTQAHENADHTLAVKVDIDSQTGKGDAKRNSPIGIAIDETGVPRRPEEERKVAAADKIAAEIWRGVDDNGGYNAMSTKAKAAAKKHEEEMDRKYANRKRADVNLTEESIWDAITEDFGEAPQVELPGEGSSDSKSTDSLPEAMTSDKPEEAKAVSDKESPVEKALESEEKPSGAKSKLFQNKDKKEEPKKDEPEEKSEPQTEEEKTASAKTATWMNRYEVEEAVQIFNNDPVLGPVVRFLQAFVEEVDSHSDGWSTWRLPAQAAAQLMTLIKTAEDGARRGQKHQVTPQAIAKAMAPIKSFMTRRGLAAGMEMPKLAMRVSKKVAEEIKTNHCPLCGENRKPNDGHKCTSFTPGNEAKHPIGDQKVGSSKKADDVQSDVAEAKSEVVSPDTVDADIKQPTESVEQAAKVSNRPGDEELCTHEWKKKDSDDKADYYTCACGATKAENKKKATPGVKTVKVVGAERTGDPNAVEQYAGEKGCRTYVGKAPNGHVCMKPEVVIHDGRKYCEEHRPAESKKACEELDAMAGDKKTSADVSGDVSEAKSELDGGAKAELADNSDATKTVNPEHFAADGDENDESIEMTLGLGDLADLAANLPSQDIVVTAAGGDNYIIRLVVDGETCYIERHFDEGNGDLSPIMEKELATKFSLEEAKGIAGQLKSYDPSVTSAEVIIADEDEHGTTQEG